MLTNSSTNYPLHPEFEELLNSCGSMTVQLESLGRKLSLSLIQEGICGNRFERYTLLKLNNTPVVAAYSYAKLEDKFFCELLQNSNNIPIGKFLFAAKSQVSRQENMQITQLQARQIDSLQLQQTLLAANNYLPSQQFWQRTSVFNYQQQQLLLLEILLPELKSFI